MNLSKRANGIYYIYYFQLNGKRTCISTGTKFKTEALKFLSDFQEEIKKRNLSKVIPKTILEFRYEYASYSESVHRPKTTKRINSILKEFAEYFNNPQLSEIDMKQINSYLQHKAKVSSYTAQQHLAYLRSAFKKAQTDGYILSNPFESVSNFKIPEKQPLFIDETSFHCLLRVIDNTDIKHIVTFAVKTGLRLMELITLEWKQINFRDKYLILDNNNHTTKSKKVRTIPLTIEAMQILVERESTRNSDYVFTFDNEKIKPESLSKRFKKYVVKAKLNPKLKFHSLRHTFASWLVQRGVSIYQVSKLLGHANVETTEIYSHLRAEDLRSAINVLNN
ncbi:MAG: tyrosine-type recombinase/integrase [Melioribacteraceae bacterium]|nr:tyrosine-type recombinase/integrase [Melioribacteraceae bacterium]